jgi:transposase
MTKSDLKIRLSHHQKARRIEAHLLLHMISLCIMRIMEDQVKKCGLTLHQALQNNKTNVAIIGSKEKIIYGSPTLHC